MPDNQNKNKGPKFRVSFKKGQKIKEGLAGFEDFFNIEESESAIKDGQKIDDHKISSFLETEENRVRKIDLLLSEKINILAKASQIPALIKIEERKRSEFRDEIVNFSLNNSSPLNQNLKLLFNNAFSENPSGE